MPNAQCIIVTPYHFGPSDRVSFSRLVRSLQVTIEELDERGKLVLVANGTEDGAAEPYEVLRQLSAPTNVVTPVTLRKNANNTGGLNAGIAMALRLASTSETSWIGSVQSSVTLSPGWLTSMLEVEAGSSTCGLFGTLKLEGKPETVWANGHYLCEGKTYQKKPESDRAKERVSFPCLSACLFRGTAVAAVVERYGNFVCENLPHYPDCTDVALRLLTVNSRATFQYESKASGLKREPTFDIERVLTSQIVAARLYYPSHCGERAVRRAHDKLKAIGASHRLIDVLRDADKRVAKRYSPSEPSPPSASALFDPDWCLR